jgi:hypothetical protein
LKSGSAAGGIAATGTLSSKVDKKTTAAFVNFESNGESKERTSRSEEMKKIKILKIDGLLVPNARRKLNAAAKKISEQTGFSITPTATGFTLPDDEWRPRFASEEDFARRIARDLAITSEVMFEAVIE